MDIQGLPGSQGMVWRALCYQRRRLDITLRCDGISLVYDGWRQPLCQQHLRDTDGCVCSAWLWRLNRLDMCLKDVKVPEMPYGRHLPSLASLFLECLKLSQLTERLPRAQVVDEVPRCTR